MSGISRNNTYIINSGTPAAVAGGRSDTSIAENNKVIVNGGTLNNYVTGAETVSGVARNNNLTINGGTINDWAYGGFAQGLGNVENNIVNIYGGNVNNVAGGISGSRNATGNTVNLYDVNDITGLIQGGKTTGGTSADNTVNILGTIGVTGTLDGDTIQSLNVYSKSNSVGAITGSIDNMYFYLPAGISAGNTMLKVTGETSLTGTNIDWSTSTKPNMEVG
jgi:hypothetical protein